MPQAVDFSPVTAAVVEHRVLLGGVSEGVLHRATGPVLIVPSRTAAR